MKNFIIILLIYTLWLSTAFSTTITVRQIDQIDPFTGSVSIGSGLANANAILDVQSTTKAFMPPRMTTAQKLAIPSPTAGMVIFDTNIGQQSTYTGTAWTSGLGTIGVDTDWIACTFTTLAWQGLGTVANNSLQCRRQGPNLQMKGTLTVGTSTSSIVQIPLPSNYGALTTASTVATDSYGYILRGVSSAGNFYNIIATVGQNYFNTSSNSSTNPTTAVGGTSLANPSDVLVFSNVSIPITGWSSTTTTYSTISANFDWTALNSSAISAGFGTPTGVSVFYKRDGGDLLISGSFITGSIAASLAFITLPNSLQVDTTKLPSTISIVGRMLRNIGASTAGDYFSSVLTDPANPTKIYFGTSNNSNIPITPQNGIVLYGSSSESQLFENVRIPIRGWSSASQVFTTIPTPATIKDVKASGTNGGGTSASVYQTRTLNNLDDPSGIVTSLSANQFILAAGTYYIRSSAPAYAVSQHQTRIRNITDSTTALVGSTEYSLSTVNGRSIIRGTITITSSKTFELQHYTQSAQASNGFGSATATGEVEVYSIVEINKLR
jgi:hypothetical protein